MGNIDLNSICNIIILASAVIIAIKNIYGFFKKPVDTLQERATEREEERIRTVLRDNIPEIFEDHCNAINEKYDKDLEKVIEKIDELKQMQVAQNTEITSIQSKLDLLNNAQMDMMRYNMNRIFYKYLPYKKILACDKKAFTKLYNDYKSMKGNTWIDDLYNQIKDWTIVETQEDLEKKEEEQKS